MQENLATTRMELETDMGEGGHRAQHSPAAVGFQYLSAVSSSCLGLPPLRLRVTELFAPEVNTGVG